MRKLIAAALLALAACASPQQHRETTTYALTPADASTALLSGDRLSVQRTVYEAPEGQDPLIEFTLRHSDGRVMMFQAANHAPENVMAQAPGGALAQVMGLFGDEAPVLYAQHTPQSSGAPFICAPNGPLYIGYYEAADGAVQIVGLKQAIEFETRPDGSSEAIPYSPDQVCARLRLRRG